MGFQEFLANFKRNMELSALKMQLRAASEGEREAAIRELSNTGLPEMVDPIIKRLSDLSPGVRRAAATALGVLGDVRAVESLVLALKDTKYNVRRAAVASLGQLGSARTIEPLVGALKDPDQDVRKLAFEGLVRLGAPATPSLLACLQASEENVRQDAIRALGVIKAPEAIEPLVAMLKHGQADAQLAAEALDALNWRPMNPAERVLFAFTRGRYDDPVSDGAAAVEPLIAALADNKVVVRRSAARALGLIGDQRAVVPLIGLVKDDHPEVRENVYRALGELGDERALDALIVGNNDDNLEARGAAVTALGALKHPRALEALMASARHGDNHIRGSAIEAMGAIDDPRVIEPLVNALTDKRHNVRKAAADALVKQGGSIVEALLPALNSADEVARASAAETLGQLADPSAVPSLLGTLHDKAVSVRKEAAKALGNIRDGRAIDALAGTLNDENPDVRGAAATALGQIGDGRIVPVLLEKVADLRIAALVTDALAAMLATNSRSLAVDDLQVIARFADLQYETVEYDALIGNVPVKHDLDTSQLVQAALNELTRRGVRA